LTVLTNRTRGGGGSRPSKVVARDLEGTDIEGQSTMPDGLIGDGTMATLTVF